MPPQKKPPIAGQIGEKKKPGPRKRQVEEDLNDASPRPEKKQPKQQKQAQVDVDANVNAEYLTKVIAAIEQIFGNETFKDIMTQPALSAGKNKCGLTGHRPPISLDVVAAMDESTAGGGNLFWLNATHLPNPGVPVNMKKVTTLKMYHHGTPSPPCEQLIIGVPKGLSKDDLLTKCTTGQLHMVSPPEILHAWLFRLAERIADGMDEDELRRANCLTNIK